MRAPPDIVDELMGVLSALNIGLFFEKPDPNQKLKTRAVFDIFTDKQSLSQLYSLVYVHATVFRPDIFCFSFPTDKKIIDNVI